MAVSADGSEVVGKSNSSASEGAGEAFRWTEGTGMAGLGDLPGGDFASDARDVSAGGSVVVGAGNTDIGSEAFIWDADHGMRNVRQVLTDAGLDMTGWTLSTVGNVSADGTVLVGAGTNPLGRYEAWRAVVPEPSSITLLGSALLGLLVYASRRRPRGSS